MIKKKEVHIRSSTRQKFGWEGKHKGRKKSTKHNFAGIITQFHIYIQIYLFFGLCFLAMPKR
jgi:hypothetical protein